MPTRSARRLNMICIHSRRLDSPPALEGPDKQRTHLVRRWHHRRRQRNTQSKTTTKSWRGLVWGCERPELLITETFAFHDRRTEDFDNEQPRYGIWKIGIDATKKTKVTRSNDRDHDASFDQRLMPRSGFFLELYNPWANNAPFQPGEFYSNVINNGSSGGRALLGSPAERTPSPIWRLLVDKS